MRKTPSAQGDAQNFGAGILFVNPVLRRSALSQGGGFKSGVANHGPLVKAVQKKLIVKGFGVGPHGARWSRLHVYSPQFDGFRVATLSINWAVVLFRNIVGGRHRLYAQIVSY
jgi:hypothetical protein